MTRARYLRTGFLALEPKAFGAEFEVVARAKAEPFVEVGRVAVIRIDGPLDEHPNWLFQDYETLHAQATAAFASPCAAVALRINSPGGACAGCFELARALRSMSDESGKTLGVFVDGQATSAAYGLACAATPGMLWAPPTSTVASLAVYETLIDQTAADAAMGVRFLFVPSSGADLKLTGNAHVAPSDVMVEHTQAQVDLLTSYFYELIEEMRGVPEADIRALRGASLLASQGVDRALVDAVSDWTGFLAGLETFKGKANMPAQAKAKSPFGDALLALAEAAKADDDEGKAAQKMLAAHYGADAPDGDAKPEKKDDDAEARAEEPEKKDPPVEEKKPEAAQAQAASAIGTASNELTLAQQVHALQAKISGQEEASARAALLAQRPDFSAEVRKTLAMSPLSAVEHAVKHWPRVTATPQAAAAAATPEVTPGKLDTAQHGGLREDEREILANWAPKPGPAQARMAGTTLVLEHMSQSAAAARLREMAAEGLLPGGKPLDMGRVAATEFKATPSRK